MVRSEGRPFSVEVGEVEWGPSPVVVQAGFHLRFLHNLAGWLAALQWSVSTIYEECWEISWLEWDF